MIDQCFEDTVFDGNEMFNIINYPGMWERTILVSSFSKGMGVCGLRLAYIVAHENIMSVLHATAVFYIGAPNTMVQWGIMAALENPDFMEKYRKEFQYRGLASYEIIKNIPNTICGEPESCFFLWLDVRKLGTSSEICDYLLQDAKVAVTAGEMFGPEGKNGIRIVYGSKLDRKYSLNVIRRIRDSLMKHPKNI